MNEVTREVVANQCSTYECTNDWDTEKRVQLERGWVFDVKVCDECVETMESASNTVEPWSDQQ